MSISQKLYAEAIQYLSDGGNTCSMSFATILIIPEVFLIHLLHCACSM